MSLPRPSGPSRSPLDGIKRRSVSMGLPYRGVERRDPAHRQALVDRLIAEFNEMPGLRLSVAQATRLFGLKEAAALRILTHLTETGTLQRNASNFYMRRDRG